MLKFKDMPYERPDMESAKAQIKGCAESFRAAENAEQAKQILIEYDKIQRHVESMATLLSPGKEARSFSRISIS